MAATNHFGTVGALGRRVSLTIAAATAFGSPAAWGSGGAPAEAGAHAGDKAAPARTDLLNLDGFRIRGCRRTDQEVIDLQFGVCLVLSSKTTASDVERLQLWKNRLRDQVITAVRSADPQDFADPDLRRLQRLIVFRVKRLPIGNLILGVYFTDFSMDAGETLADQLVPPVTPSAAPKKSSGGGH